MKTKISVGNITAEFEGTPDEVQISVEKLLSTITEKYPNLQTTKTESKKTYVGSLTARLEELIEEGFFDQPKPLGETLRKLAERGYHYPNTTLSPTLLQLVRQKRLRRIGEQGGFTYVKP